MRRALLALLLAGAAPLAAVPSALPAGAQTPGDWRGDRPGAEHRITPAELPKPYATRSASNGPAVTLARGRMPVAPAGFAVTRWAEGLDAPRAMAVAPNGDVFVAETAAGDVRLLRPGAGGKVALNAVYASDLDEPFGIAFYPPGPNPEWVYVANTNSVVRFPYQSGDTASRGVPRTIIPVLVGSGGGHSTRDIRFSPDGRRMFVSVGSGSNVAEEMPRLRGQALQQWAAGHALGAAWGDEEGRADVLAFDPDGGGRSTFATGIRNCVGLAVQPKADDPKSGELWCATNERDGLGDDLVPDYITHVKEGGFYGWPWYYTGDHEDPRLAKARPDLAGKAIVPDVLIQSHSAALGLAFYRHEGDASFPSRYDGDAFVALHGSWNRAHRTGYKVVRAPMKDGVATGAYEDFLTGFVVDDRTVIGRPVGITEAKDGALLVSDDGNGVIYRVAPDAQRAAR